MPLLDESALGASHQHPSDFEPTCEPLSTEVQLSAAAGERPGGSVGSPCEPLPQAVELGGGAAARARSPLARPAASSPASARPAPPDRFTILMASLTVGETIGTGSSGVVFQGTYLGNPVALKQVLVGHDEALQERFTQEVRWHPRTALPSPPPPRCKGPRHCFFVGLILSKFPPSRACLCVAVQSPQVGILGGLSHPHILRMFGVGYKFPHAYIVTERCWGSLLALLRLPRPTPPYSVRMRWALDIAYAMEFLHERGIVHR